MKNVITFVSGNLSKVKLTEHYFPYPLQHRKIDLTEIQSFDLREIAENKARQAYRTIGSPVLVEDTSLVFRALGNLPGPFIKWFLQELGRDGLIQLLAHHRDRSAVASVCFGYFTGRGDVSFFEGSMAGSISMSPRGSGFGWTPIFIPKGYKRTWGELTLSEQDKTSMRRIALGKLTAFLKGGENGSFYSGS